MRIAIIGSGASGLVAAITIKRYIDCEIKVFEALDSAGKKLKATGNGRGNIFNEDLNPKYYNHPFFVKNVIDKISIDVLKEFFKSIGILTKTDNAKRIYPYTEEAITILENLKLEACKLNISFLYNIEIRDVIFSNNLFCINNEYFDYLIISTGGKSNKSLGGLGSGYVLARKLGHEITPLKPALTPFYTKNNLEILEGIRKQVRVKIGDFDEIGEVLFKKNGLSGIVVFNMSSYLARVDYKYKDVHIDFFYDYSLDDLIRILEEIKEKNSWKYVDSLYLGILNKNVYHYILNESKIDYKGKKASNLNKKDIIKLATLMKSLIFILDKPYDFNYSQVTNGGVKITTVDESFKSKINDKLYFTGEILDIDGICGGYNLYFAFASGIIAGMDVVKSVNR